MSGLGERPGVHDRLPARLEQFPVPGREHLVALDFLDVAFQGGDLWQVHVLDRRVDHPDEVAHLENHFLVLFLRFGHFACLLI